MIGFLTRKKRAVPGTSAHDILPMGSFLNYDLLSTTLPSISTKLTSPTQIYAIKKSEGFFHTEKPVTSTLISDVMYDFNNMEKKAEPTEMNSAVLENYSHIPQTVTRTISYTEERAFSFDFGTSISVGISVEVGVGIPIPVISSEINIDVAVTVTATTGFEIGEC